MKYRKKPVVIDATQWWMNGDHPDDGCFEIAGTDGPFKSEGKVVRYYRSPKIDGQERCKHCNNIMHLHGWIDTLEGGHIVCPGDFIITGVKDEVYPCKPDIFAETYEAVTDDGRLALLKDKFRAMMSSALASGEMTPDVCQCVECVTLRQQIDEATA